MTGTGRPEAGVRIVIDGQAFELPADTNLAELRRRVAQAVFRCEVEQLHLANGRTMLVNWRSVRTIQIELDSIELDNPAARLPHGFPPTVAEHPSPGDQPLAP